MYNLAQTSEKLLFMRILNDAVNSMSIEYTYKGNGRPPIGMEDMIKCCVIKVFNCFSCRRTVPDLHMAKGLGYIEIVPHFNSLSNYMKMTSLTPYLEHLYRVLAIPFIDTENYFAIDSTGFGKYNTIWLNSKYKQGHMRSFNKLHIITGVKSTIIAVAKISDARQHDVLNFSRMLKESCKYFKVKEIYADKGYLSYYNCKDAVDLGVTPYILPKRTNKISKGTSWRDTEAWNRMILLWKHNEDIFRQHYNKRNNVESAFSSMKRKFLPYIRSKSAMAQKNEILSKVCCHNTSVLVNGIFELGASATFKEYRQ